MASTIYVRTTPEMKERIENVARENRRKLNAQVELMLEEWFETHSEPVRTTHDKKERK